MRVLITRPAEDAERFAAALRAMGHEALLEPVLRIQMLDVPIPDFDASVQAILITSAQAARALALRTGRRDLRLLAVGPHSAEIARDSGFRLVAQSNGDGIAGLHNLVRAHCDPKSGALLHLAAEDLAGDLAGGLRQAGFTVHVIQLYKAEAIEALSEPVISELRAGAVDAVTFFSKRSAAIFEGLARPLDGIAWNRIAAAAISASVVEGLGLPYRARLAAEVPTQDGVIRALSLIAGRP